MKHLLFLLMLPVAGYGQRNEYRPEPTILSDKVIRQSDLAVFDLHRLGMKDYFDISVCDTDFVIRPVTRKEVLGYKKPPLEKAWYSEYLSDSVSHGAFYPIYHEDTWDIEEKKDCYILKFYPSQLIKINDSTFKVMK